MKVIKTLKVSKTDGNGNVHTLHVWKMDDGSTRTALKGKHGDFSLANAYMGFHPKGVKGAKAQIRQIAETADNAEKLAFLLGFAGYSWKTA